MILSYVPANAVARFWQLFLICLLVTLCSKGMALMPGYALDDYTVTYIDATVPYYLSQGRFTQALLQWLATEARVNITAIYWPVTFAMLMALPGMVAFGFSRIGGERTPLAAQALGAAIVCAHPYFTEYFTFRQALYNALFYVLLMWAHLWFVFRIQPDQAPWSRANLGAVSASSFALFMALGGHQLTFAMSLSIVAMALLVARAEEPGAARRPTGLWLRQSAISLSPYVAAALAYAIVYVLIKKFSGAANDPRGNILAMAQWPERFGEVLALCRKILFESEPVLSRLAKLLLLASAVLLFLGALFRRAGVAWLVVLALVALGAAGLAPVGLSGQWWPVPRSLSALSFTTGAIAAALLILGRSRLQPLAVAGIAGAVVLMTFNSASMLSDQSRLNRWDLNKAQLIAHDVARAYGPEALARTRLVNGGWAHPVQVKSLVGDLNSSAFIKPWSYPGLLMEASGYTANFNGDTDPAKTECGQRPRWPALASIYKSGEEVFVCL